MSKAYLSLYTPQPFEAADFFAATPQYLTHIDDALLELGDNDATFLIICRPRLGTPAGNRVVFSKYTTSNASWRLHLSTSGVWRFQASATGSGVTQIGGTHVAQDEELTFIIVRYNATSDLLDMSLNGVLSGTEFYDSGSLANGFFDGTAPVRIGSHGDSTLQWDGQISRFAIWKGRRVSDSEITQLYSHFIEDNQLDLPVGFSTNLMAYWKLNEISDGSSPVTREDSGPNNLDLSDSSGNNVSSIQIFSESDKTDYDVIDQAEISESVGKIGSLIVKIPRNNLPSDLESLHEAGFSYVDDGGEIFRGYITLVEVETDRNGVSIASIVVEGREVELQWLSTDIGIILDNAAAQDSLDAILLNTGWTGTVEGAGFTNITARYDAVSRWDALQEFALTENCFVRINRLDRTIQVRKAALSSGITLVSSERQIPSEYGLISNLNRIRNPTLYNRIIPAGSNSGNIIYDLGLSIRTSPYTIQNFIKNRPSVTNISNADIWTGGLSIDVVGFNTAVVLFVGINTGNSIVNASCGGKPMVRLFDRYNAAVNVHLDVWYVVGVKGTVSISINWNDDTTPPVNRAIAIALQDVDQRNPIRDSQSSNSTTSTPATPSITTGINDLLLGVIRAGSSVTITGRGAGQSSLTEVTYGSTSRLGVDKKDGIAGTTTLSWTLSASVENQRGGLSIRPYTTYYIEDSDSILKYKRRDRYLFLSTSKLVGATATQLQNAANTLYDLAAVLLELNKDPYFHYEPDIIYLPNANWLIGDSLILDLPTYEINGLTLISVSRKQTFDSEGIRHWKASLSTVASFQRTLYDEVKTLTSQLKGIENAIR